MNKRVSFLLFFLALIVGPFILVGFFWCLSATAQSVEKGQSVCYEVENAVNTLLNSTQTKCLPAGGKAGALSFIVTSSEPVFSVEASKKAWVLVAVVAIGKYMNDQPSVKVDELWLSDVNQMKGHVFHVIPVSLAKSLQRQVYNEQLGPDDMWATIKKNLVQKHLQTE